MEPCIWTTPLTSNEALLAGSENLKTIIKPNEYAEEDGRSNGWNGFDDDDTGANSTIWDD